MKQLYYYQHPTRYGPVSITPEKNGRFAVWFDEEHLGSYAHAHQAADDVSGGHTFSPSSGVDLGELGISADINEWQRLPHMRVGE